MSQRRSDIFFEDVGSALGRQTARSGLVALVSNEIQMALGIGTTLVLVRILSPEDFGVFAIAWVVVQLIATVRDVGISTAIVNAENLTREKVSGLFWSGQVMNLLVTSVVALLGPILGAFYGMQELGLLMPTVALASLLTGFTSVHDGLLKRRLFFGTVAAKDISGMAAGAVAAIVVALMGYGVWALAAQQLAQSGARLAVCVFSTRWFPSNPLSSFRSARRESELIWHGVRLSLSKCIGTLGASADRLILGGLVGDRVLGFYQQAYVWSEFPSRQVYFPMMGVVIAAFSRKQNAEDGSYPAGFRQAVLVLYAIAIPMLIFGAIRGELVIGVLLGEQWVEAAPFFSILCVAMLFRLIIQAGKWVFLAESRSNDQLIWTLVFVPVLVAGAAIGAFRGEAVGVSIAVLLVHAVAAPFAVWMSCRGSQIRPLDMLMPAMRPMLASAVASVLVLSLGSNTDSYKASVLALCLGVAIFMLCNAVAWLIPGRGRDELRSCIEHLSPKIASIFGTSVRHRSGSGLVS